MSRMRSLRYPAAPLEELNQLVILWGGEFALEVPHVDCRQPPSRYNRDKLRYPSDLTAMRNGRIIEPLIPPGKPGGGKRRVAIREVINGVMYILSTGCQWRAPLPAQGFAAQKHRA